MTIQKSVADNCPSFFRGSVAGRLFESIGAVADQAIETQVTGLQQGDPLRCDASALPRIALDRGLRRYPTESEESHRQRLAGWREDARHRGSLYGQLRHVQRWFSPQRPVVRAVHQSGSGTNSTWHTLDADGVYSVYHSTPSNWDWDSDTNVLSVTMWGRYWILVYTDTLDASQLIDAERWDAGATYDSHAIWDGIFSHDQIHDMVSVCNDSKAAHSILWGLFFVKDASVFVPSGSGAGYPDGTWGLVTDPVTGLPTRRDSVIYAYEVHNYDLGSE